MTTEKLFIGGYISEDIICDSAAGVDSILAWFEHLFFVRAGELGYVALVPPKIYFERIDPFSESVMDVHMHESKMLKVKAVGRAVKVTKIDVSFPAFAQGVVYSC